MNNKLTDEDKEIEKRLKNGLLNMHIEIQKVKDENGELRDELDFVYSQIRKHDYTGILKTLFKSRIERRER